MAVIYVSTWSGFHTNYPQALHSADTQPNWAALAALSTLSTLRHSDHTTAVVRGGGAGVAWGWWVWGAQTNRVNHSNTLMGTKTPITERASELAAPFAPHMEGTV